MKGAIGRLHKDHNDDPMSNEIVTIAPISTLICCSVAN
jgi:hypothetical protein